MEEWQVLVWNGFTGILCCQSVTLVTFRVEVNVPVDYRIVLYHGQYQHGMVRYVRTGAALCIQIL